MKYLVLVALLAVAAVAQDVPNFGGGDLVFGEEPDKDGDILGSGVTTEEVKPTTEPPTEPTEEPKPQQAAPDFGQDPTPPDGGADADDVLPTPENCTGVTCDIEAIRNCEKPVLFAKQCCPVCPPADPCTNVNCSNGEVCTVHANTAICCTDLTKKANGGGHSDRHHRPRVGWFGRGHHGDDGDRRPSYRRGRGKRGVRSGRGKKHDHAYSTGSVHVQNLPCRYDLPNNCTIRFRKKEHMSATDTCNGTCNSTEKCTTKYTRQRGWFFVYHRRRMNVCCAVPRPECPIVAHPTVLGHCRLPNETVPDHMRNCSCEGTPRLVRGTPGGGTVLLQGGRRGRYYIWRLRQTCSNAVSHVYKVMRLSGTTGSMSRSLALCRCNCQTVEAFEGSLRSTRRCRRRKLRHVDTNQCRRI